MTETQQLEQTPPVVTPVQWKRIFGPAETGAVVENGEWSHQHELDDGEKRWKFP